jgi:KDO2-lipid IV(A) lauroyltransferase
MLVLRWLSRWPLWLLHAIGAPLGWLVWALSPSYRRRLRANADVAGVSGAARRRSVSEAGRMVTELPWLLLRAEDEPLGDHVEWPSPERTDAIVASGRPLVLLTPHMGSFEASARAWVERYGARQPLTVLYRPAKQAWLRRFQETTRERPGLMTAPASLAGVRQMLRALRRGEAVGLLPDQVPPAGQGVWAPFFTLPAYTMTLAARLVQQTGANIVVMRCERLPHGRGWRMLASELVAPLPAGTSEEALAEAATIVNRTMERTILEDPGQYLWAYNRYKQPRAAEADAAPATPATEGIAR